MGLNRKAYEHARRLIAQGKIDRKSPWRWDTADENALLGDPPDWERYSLWHLFRDPNADPKTKSAYKFPYGKNGKVYLSALRAIRQRAGQHGYQDIFEAAGRLLALAEEKELKAFPLSTGTKLPADAPQEILLLPRGEVHTDKGDFLVDEEALSEIVRRFREKGVDLVVDYEHQTLYGGQAPAAGWIKELLPREDGLWARVEWTDTARRMIAAKEYRYLSPVVLVRKSDGRAVRISSVALTNLPAIHGLRPIVNKGLNGEGESQNKEEGMDFLARLKEILGLGEESGATEVEKALKELKGLDQEFKIFKSKLAAMLDCNNEATTEELLSTLESKLAGTGAKEMELAARVAELEKQIRKREAEDLVEKALSEGRITPALKDWAMQLALKDVQAFKEFCAKQTPLSTRLVGSETVENEISLGREIAQSIGK